MLTLCLYSILIYSILSASIPSLKTCMSGYVPMTDNNYHSVLNYFRICRDLANRTSEQDIDPLHYLRKVARNLKDANEVFLKDTTLTSKRLKTIEAKVNMLYQDLIRMSDEELLDTEYLCGDTEQSLCSTAKTETTTIKKKNMTRVSSSSDNSDHIKSGSYTGKDQEKVAMLMSDKLLSIYLVLINVISLLISIWIARYIYKIYHQRAKYISCTKVASRSGSESPTSCCFFKKGKKKEKKLPKCPSK